MSRRAVSAVVLTLALASAMTGCSSVPGSLDQSLGDAIAATSTARLTTSLQLDGTATMPFLATTYGDMLVKLQDADTSVGSLAATPAEATHRRDVQQAIRRATDAVVTAQEDLNSGSSLKPDLSALKSALAELKKVKSS
jgi:hypothetical protein